MDFLLNADKQQPAHFTAESSARFWVLQAFFTESIAAWQLTSGKAYLAKVISGADKDATLRLRTKNKNAGASDYIDQDSIKRD